MLKPFKVRPGAFSKTYSSVQLTRNKQNVGNLANVQYQHHNQNEQHTYTYDSQSFNQDNYNFPLAVSVQKHRKSLVANKQTNASISKKTQKLALKFEQDKAQKQQKQIKHLKQQLRNLQKNQKLFDQKIFQQESQIQQMINHTKTLQVKVEEQEGKCSRYSQTIKLFIYWIMKLFNQSTKYAQKTRGMFDQASVQYKYRNFMASQLIQMFKKVNSYIQIIDIRNQLMRIAQKQSIFQQNKEKDNRKNINMKPTTVKISQQINKATQQDFIQLQKLKKVNQFSNINALNSIFTQEDILQNLVIFAQPQNLLDTFNLKQIQGNNGQNHKENDYNGNHFNHQINSIDQEKTNQLFENVNRRLFQQSCNKSKQNESFSQVQTPQLSQYEFYDKQNQTEYGNSNQFISDLPPQLSSNTRSQIKINHHKSVNQMPFAQVQGDYQHKSHKYQDKQQISQNSQLRQSTEMYASQNYNSTKQNHIKVQKGEKIKLLKRVKNDLWIAECGDRLGYISQTILTTNTNTNNNTNKQ